MQYQKYALVTGGNRGIGLEVCRKLVQRGKPVLLTARSAEAAEQAAQQLRGPGSVDVQAFALEAGDAASINQFVKSLEHYDQNFDLLVGISCWRHRTCMAAVAQFTAGLKCQWFSVLSNQADRLALWLCINLGNHYHAPER